MTSRRSRNLIRSLGSQLFGKAVTTLSPYIGSFVVDATKLGNLIGLPTEWSEALTHRALEGLSKVATTERFKQGLRDKYSGPSYTGGEMQQKYAKPNRPRTPLSPTSIFGTGIANIEYATQEEEDILEPIDFNEEGEIIDNTMIKSKKIKKRATKKPPAKKRPAIKTDNRIKLSKEEKKLLGLEYDVEI